MSRQFDLGIAAARIPQNRKRNHNNNGGKKRSEIASMTSHGPEIVIASRPSATITRTQQRRSDFHRNFGLVSLSPRNASRKQHQNYRLGQVRRVHRTVKHMSRTHRVDPFGHSVRDSSGCPPVTLGPRALSHRVELLRMTRDRSPSDANRDSADATDCPIEPVFCSESTSR